MLGITLRGVGIAGLTHGGLERRVDRPADVTSQPVPALSQCERVDLRDTYLR
jgi:hypothetical protein